MPAARRMAAVRGGYYTRAVGLRGLGDCAPTDTACLMQNPPPGGGCILAPGQPVPSWCGYALPNPITAAPSYTTTGLLAQEAAYPFAVPFDLPFPGESAQQAGMAPETDPISFLLTATGSEQNPSPAAAAASGLQIPTPGNPIQPIPIQAPPSDILNFTGLGSSPNSTSIPTWVWLVGGGLTLLLAYATIKNIA